MSGGSEVNVHVQGVSRLNNELICNEYTLKMGTQHFPLLEKNSYSYGYNMVIWTVVSLSRYEGERDIIS